MLSNNGTPPIAIPKLSDGVKWDGGAPFVSFEFFPPKTDEGTSNLLERIERLGKLRPAWVDVTWGAGGQDNDRTLSLCATIQQQLGIPVLMHLTCSNVPKQTVVEVLKEARALGIRNLLAVRGDPPIAGITDDGQDTLHHAIDLVRLIRSEHGDYFCIAVAGYPEGHFESTSFDDDIGHLKAKVDAGADFVVTQLFYDVDIYKMFLRECDEAGIKCPIVAGIMPITSFERFNRITHLTQVIVPEDVVRSLYEAKMDDEKVRAYGVQYVVQMIRRLLDMGVHGIHFYTLNLEKAVEAIIREIPALTSGSPLPAASTDEQPETVTTPAPHWPTNRRRQPYKNSAEFAWDEFTHERWGDARSAAYMSMLDDVWYASLQNSKIRSELALSLSSAKEAGGSQPITSTSDVNQFFVAFVQGKLRALPWTPEALSVESNTIRDALVALNTLGMLTISSQPAVDSAPSDDPLYGWGPVGGRVYQKAYVEFFCSPDLWARLLREVLQQPQAGRLSYMAVRAQGGVVTSRHGFKRSTVTWGVFADMEIVESTVIDEDGLLLWRDQAFQLWRTSWADRATAASARAVLLDIQATYWLVNIIDDDFKQQQPGQLFATLCALLNKAS